MKATYQLNDKLGGVEISFPSKPDRDTLDKVKQKGFKWSRFNKVWWAKQSPERISFAQSIAEAGAIEKSEASKSGKRVYSKKEYTQKSHKESMINKLEKWMATLEKQIDQKRNPATASQNPTRRRASIIASMAADADVLERQYNVLAALQKEWERDGKNGYIMHHGLKTLTTKKSILKYIDIARDKGVQNISRITFNEIIRKLKASYGENAQKAVRGIGVIIEATGYYALTDTERFPTHKISSDYDLKYNKKLLKLMIKHKQDRNISPIEISLMEELISNAEIELKFNKARDKYFQEKYKSITHQERMIEVIGIRDFFANNYKLDDETGRKEKNKLKELQNSLIGVKIPGYFNTPKEVVEQVIELADIQKGDKVLEPSAGAGDLADAAKKSTNYVDVVEYNSRLREILKLKGYELKGQDFFNFDNKGFYDKIVMNPPFEKLADIDHISHAWKQLKPGGTLVSITSESPFFRKEKKAQAFREFVNEFGYSEKLPEGSFKKSRNSTGVNTRVIVLEKPGQSKSKQTNLKVTQQTTKEAINIIRATFNKVKSRNISDIEKKIVEGHKDFNNLIDTAKLDLKNIDVFGEDKLWQINNNIIIIEQFQFYVKHQTHYMNNRNIKKYKGIKTYAQLQEYIHKTHAKELKKIMSRDLYDFDLRLIKKYNVGSLSKKGHSKTLTLLKNYNKEKVRTNSGATNEAIKAIRNRFNKAKVKPKKYVKIKTNEREKIDASVRTDEKYIPSYMKADVYLVPLSDIETDVQLFQNRKERFSQTTFDNIMKDIKAKKFIMAVMDPILLWRNPDNNRLYVLAGHSRKETFEAAYKKGYKSGKYNFSKIPARIIDGQKIDLKTAMYIARNSNNLATKENTTDRVIYYKNLAKEMTEKDLSKQIVKFENKNASRIKAYVKLSENGVQMLDTAMLGGETNAVLKQILYIVGYARMKNPQLTNTHEREMINFLIKGGYGSGSGKIKGARELDEKVKALIKKKGDKFNSRTALNLKSIRGKSFALDNFDKDTNLFTSELRQAEKKRDEAGLRIVKRQVKNKVKLTVKKQDEAYNEAMKPHRKRIDGKVRKLRNHLMKRPELIKFEDDQNTLFE